MTREGGAKVTMTSEAPPARTVTGEPFRVEVEVIGEKGRWHANAVRHNNLAESYAYGIDLRSRWMPVEDFRVMREGDDVPWAVFSCPGCAPYVAGLLGPSHRGSEGCESGSLASGGDRAHCTCGPCF